eukprot:840059_1
MDNRISDLETVKFREQIECLHVETVRLSETVKNLEVQITNPPASVLSSQNGKLLSVKVSGEKFGAPEPQSNISSDILTVKCTNFRSVLEASWGPKPKHSLSRKAHSFSGSIVSQRKQTDRRASEKNKHSSTNKPLVDRRMSDIIYSMVSDPLQDELHFADWLRNMSSDLSGQTLAFGTIYKFMKQYIMLTSLMNSISMDNDINKTFSNMTGAMRSILACDRLQLFLVDENGFECYQDDSSKTIKLLLGESIVGYVAKSGEAVNILDAYEDERFDKACDERVDYRTKSILCHPILDVSGKVIAVFEAVNKPYGFTKADEMLLETISLLCGHTLYNASIYESEVRQRIRSEAILEVAKSTASSDDIEVVIESIIQTSYKVLRCDRVTLFMVDSLTNELWCKVSKDASGFRLPMGSGIAGYVAQTGEMVNIPDAYEDNRFNPEIDKITKYSTKSVLCVPIETNGKVVGVIQCINKFCQRCASLCDVHSSSFESQDVEMLIAIAGETAGALHRKNLESTFRFILEEHQDEDIRDYLSKFMTQPSSRQSQLSDSIAISPINCLTPSSGRSDSRRHEWPISLNPRIKIDNLSSWDFDYFSLWDGPSKDDLLSIIFGFFQEFELITRFKIPTSRLRTFIVSVRDHYYPNQYHNFLHGFSVIHCVYLLLIQTRICGEHLTRLDVLCAFIAALCHDVEHPGKDNLYLINSESELAILYNDISVLENHHAAKCFQILRQEENDILCGLQPSQKKYLRKVAVAAILHTDMTRHEELVNTLKQVSELPPKQRFIKESKDDRELLVEVLVHSSDLSNPVLPFDMYNKWANRIVQEFYEQAETEKIENLDFVPYMAKKDPLSVAKLQVNFITYVVAPLWTTIFEVFPSISTPIANMKKNKMKFELRTICRSCSHEHHSWTMIWDTRRNLYNPLKKRKNLQEKKIRRRMSLINYLSK